jgi:hypothetical protein
MLKVSVLKVKTNEMLAAMKATGTAVMPKSARVPRNSRPMVGAASQVFDGELNDDDNIDRQDGGQATGRRIRPVAKAVEQLRERIEKAWNDHARELAAAARKARRLAQAHGDQRQKHHDLSYSEPGTATMHSHLAFSHGVASNHYEHAAGMYDAGDSKGGDKAMAADKKVFGATLGSKHFKGI